MIRRWKVQLTAAAQRDFGNILRWTSEHFGPRQARIYEKTLKDALHHLAQGPDAEGCRHCEEIGPTIHILHVARKRRKGRHFVVFRTAASADVSVIEVLRLLHDGMDLALHMPAANEPTA